MRLAAAAGILRPTAALLFHSRPHRLLPSPRRSSLPFARRRRHSYSSSTATALDDPPPPTAPGPPSPAPPTPTGEGRETKAARRRRARESPEGMLKHRLDMCSRDADLATALELYTAAVDPAAAVPLALHHYNCLLYLCSNAAADEPGDADAARRGFEIFAAMEAQGVEPNEATLTSLARLAAAVRDPAMAFSVVRRMAAAGIPPRLRSYGPALFAYCDARDADGAAEVEVHMDAGGVVPEETELAALLRVNADTGRADQVYRVLHRTRTLVRQVCEATAQVVEAWFRSDAAAEAGMEKWDARNVREGVVKGGGGWHGQGWLGKGQWVVGRSEMDKNGKCQSCGEKLVCIDIDPSETETFAKSLAELACKREVRDDFVRFQDWLRRNGPFDAVIDAANVGLYNSKAFSFSQVNSVVNGIQRVTKSKKLPLIVLHRSRVNCGPAKTPQNQKLIESWRNAGALYSTPPGSNDDWYWLYAAVSCRSLLVTNDEMRDHLFQLLGTSFFPRWKEKHQVRLTYSGRGPTFHLPPPYSIVIQESEAGSWHVPTTTGDDIESPRQWVCATRKTSERPPSPPPQARATSKTSERPPSLPPQARATSKTSERLSSPPPQARTTSKTSERSPSPPPQARATSKTSERLSSRPPQARATSKTSERLSSRPPQARATSKTSERSPSLPPQAHATGKTPERPPSPPPQARATRKTPERPSSPPPQASATSKT